MALAQQLAELALANSQGLLNDDEYRLLRQNLFEQHSNSALIPTEAPILPVAGPGRKSSVSSTTHISPRVRTLDTHVDTSAPRAPPLRRKGSFASGVTNLLRRATGHKTPVSSPSAHDDPPSTSPTDYTTKRSVIPRILHRKASELFSGRSDNKRVDPPTNSPRITPSSSDPFNARYPSNTPSQSTRRTAIPTFPSIPVDTSSNDVFDDRNLHTAKEIRAAIIATETEAQRLLEAFNGLETTTTHRLYQQNTRRLPSATPEHINTLIDGTDWRSHRPQKPPSPRPSQSDRKVYPYMPSAVDTTADSASVRSKSSSIQTSLSRSKSISSLRSKQHPSSPLSSRFAPPPSSSSAPRKNSVSSVTSQATSTQRLGVTGSSSWSRSTGHLPLRTLIEGEGVRADRGGPRTVDPHPEVSEIQRRRDEVMARYVARLDYLQAKLKSAELHEKLLRR
ncbi:hypothetical protein D9615_004458 [Tricholomella constricta]|uniref:Uncharacterized protein n=1 Tax=Tricholomella constricta TaxID=117010 RepID=A0A8H5HEW4_9AGAR|nr:hypothetical protein D9615_004458 [Tricholomella constricta]